MRENRLNIVCLFLAVTIGILLGRQVLLLPSTVLAVGVVMLMLVGLYMPALLKCSPQVRGAAICITVGFLIGVGVFLASTLPWTTSDDIGFFP
jgi:ABC-type Mn2+/Zn2+ transport system permease subunit